MTRQHTPDRLFHYVIAVCEDAPGPGHEIEAVWYLGRAYATAGDQDAWVTLNEDGTYTVTCQALTAGDDRCGGTLTVKPDDYPATETDWSAIYALLPFAKPVTE